MIPDNFHNTNSWDGGFRLDGDKVDELSLPHRIYHYFLQKKTSFVGLVLGSSQFFANDPTNSTLRIGLSKCYGMSKWLFSLY